MYKIGDQWSRTFDYCGMLKAGSEARVSDGKKKLRALFDSYEDVNYHTESTPLWAVLGYIDKNDEAGADNHMKVFNKISRLMYEQQCKR